MLPAEGSKARLAVGTCCELRVAGEMERQWKWLWHLLFQDFLELLVDLESGWTDSGLIKSMRVTKNWPGLNGSQVKGDNPCDMTSLDVDSGPWCSVPRPTALENRDS
ncbi:hypothetical protein TREES_T100000724 [Tupaia chinensis]|uniref:Uncharacterized protein n=1 Tax=Tupaia chinensis TaxID=246437 RepID=L9KQ94_TUPCH|nr:hypothetical protein TREES_T100000724 [Tupaia chinensis]